jgi:hypothetical protein
LYFKTKSKRPRFVLTLRPFTNCIKKIYKVKKITFPLFIVLVSTISLMGQRGWEAGGWLGASHYFGDLNTNFDISSPGLAGGLIARFNFDDRICLKFSGNVANVSADDANSNNSFERARNLSFRSLVYEGTAQLEFNFLPYVHGSADEYYTPYLLQVSR